VSLYATVNGFLLNAKPYKENHFLCDFFCLEQGRIRCQFTNSIPEYYREIEVKLSHKTDFVLASDFRYTAPVLISSNTSRLLGFYVNELVFRMLPLNFADDSIYGVYKSTLIHLELNQSIPASLRFFETQILNYLGHGLRFDRDTAENKISSNNLYNFEANKGFIASPLGRYQGKLLFAAAKGDYKTKGTLAMLRECQGQQIDSLLEGKPLNSRALQTQ